MKRTFTEFLKIYFNMSYDEYLALNEYQQKALEIQYKDMYR